MRLKENANKYSSGRGALIKKNGFTLIEVISVIIIIGILAIITVPAVSDYILGARQTTYTSHEKSMEEAANSMLIDCIDKNSNECNIPERGEKSLIYLRELIDNGYIDRLSSSNGQGYCDDTLSYVEIENTGKSNYEYKACLYCGDYITETEGCTKYENDGDKPVCGTVTGEKTEWTNKNVTILVGCSDATSGCLRDTFSKTFTETTKEGTIEIADKSGNAIDCPVNVYVDKDKPTCQLEVVSGTLEATGWYSGDVKVKLTGYTDTGSGVLTYGIGTSINNRNYNRETVIDLKTGITTVIGYVKDYAGNEGICSLDVKVGASKPTFEIEYGYQIYPNKETYTLTNMTESGTVLTTTTPDPMISFTGLGEYRNVNRVVVYLNNAITTTTTGQVFYSNGEHSEANSTRALMIAGQKEVEFVIPRGTYENIRIDLGEISGTSYDIKRIELRVGDRSNLYTNKNVTINIMPTNESVKTTEFSFDNGETWQSSNTKEVASNYTGKAVTRNNLPLTSIPVDISVGNIDKEIPSCTLKAEGIKSTSEYFGGNVTISFASATDAIANSNYASSGIKNYGIGSPSGSKSTIMTEENTTGVTYTGKVEDKAGNVGTCSIVVKKKANFTLTYNNNNGTGCSSKTITYNNAYGTLCTPTRAGYSFAGWYTAASGGTQVTSSTKLTTGQNQTIYAHWTANNYTLTYNNNGGSGCSSKPITYGSTYGTLCTPSRSGYTFLGWYTAANGGTQVTSSTALWSASNQTIYAHWEYVSVPTVIYNGGSNTCTWKNNYNFTLSSTAETGISYYEIDWNSDGIADSTTGSNFIPWNGYSSCTTRFRAVSNAGNRSGWTGNHHIHMDTQAPAHTNWWWGEVTKDVARLYIQTSDNIGINRVQCPTSTATGGYGNWYWFNAVWDATANAYRCDITPSTFNHYNQTYITHLYIYDHAGNGGYYNQTSIAIPSNTYTIFYDNNGGSGCSSQTATIGSSFGTLCTPVRDGYIFIGWFNANYKDAPLNYYSDLYADLKNAYGYDADKLYNHWVQYGAKEGRRISQYVSTDAASTNITLYAGWYKKPTPTPNPPSCEEKRECGCCGGRNEHNGYCIRYCCC